MTKFRLILRSLVLTILLLTLNSTASPQCIDSTYGCYKREKVQIALSAAYERDQLCAKNDSMQYSLNLQQEKIRRQSLVVKILLGIIATGVIVQITK